MSNEAAVHEEAPVSEAPVEEKKEVEASEATQEDFNDAYSDRLSVQKKVKEAARTSRAALLESIGITEKIVDAWKEEHGPVETLKIAGQIYIYRGMTRNELKTLDAQSDKVTDDLREEYITEKCTLWPKIDRMQFSGSGAGIPTTMANAIMELSGFVAEDEAPIRL
jgi:hypothetical protein